MAGWIQRLCGTKRLTRSPSPTRTAARQPSTDLDSSSSLKDTSASPTDAPLTLLTVALAQQVSTPPITSEPEHDDSLFPPPSLPPTSPPLRLRNKPLSIGLHSISLEPPTPIEPPLHPYSFSTPPPLPTPLPSTSSPGLSVTSLESPKPGRPGRHHRRTSSSGSFRETLNAYETEGEDGRRMVNQYWLRGVIGTGAYATVERATHMGDKIDYAVKEFSKKRLRQRQAYEARRGVRGRKRVVNAVVENEGEDEGQRNLALIRAEVAIMKKVDHPNICRIHEVIDVTASDTLLVVLELCEGGPIMHLAADNTSTKPIPEPRARSIFAQLVLGLAYLHENDIIHRDIKPDNVLFMSDLTTVKLVDFGISEQFTAKDDDSISKSAGSPAFMAPELCAAEHGQLHGFACDIWSMGVTLYALVCGRLPFAHSSNLLDLFTSIISTPLSLPPHISPALSHLLHRLLDKNPRTRITMLEVWTDPWLTSSGLDPLISYDLNCAPVEEPTEEEFERAWSSVTFVSSMLVAKAATRFMRGLSSRRSNSGGGESPVIEGGGGGGGQTSPRERAAFCASPLSSLVGDENLWETPLPMGREGVVDSPVSEEGAAGERE